MRVSEEEYQSLTATRRASATASTQRPPSVKGVIRQSARTPNATEERFRLQWLEPMRIVDEIDRYEYEAITLRLANGCRYTPDWLAVTPEGKVRFYEIKGRQVWDDAIVKLKVAAAKYFFFRFYLCAWDGRGWIVQEVLA